MILGTVTIRSDSTDDELRSFARWLRGEQEFQGRVAVAERSPETGDGAAVVDAVVVGLPGEPATALLVRSLFDWLSRQRDDCRAALTVRTGPDREGTLTCGAADDVDAVLAGLTAFFDGGRTTR